MAASEQPFELEPVLTRLLRVMERLQQTSANLKGVCVSAMKAIVTAAGDGHDGWKVLPFKGEQTLGSQLDKVLKIAYEQDFLGKLDLSHDDNGLVEQLEVALYRALPPFPSPALQLWQSSTAEVKSGILTDQYMTFVLDQYTPFTDQ